MLYTKIIITFLFAFSLFSNPNAPVPDSGSNKQDKTEDDFSDSMSSEDNSDDDDDDFSN